MLSFNSIPRARVVRKGGQQFAPPPEPGALRQHLHTVLGVALGMWPLTGVVLLLIGLLVMAGNSGAP